MFHRTMCIIANSRNLSVNLIQDQGISSREILLVNYWFCKILKYELLAYKLGTISIVE